MPLPTSRPRTYVNGVPGIPDDLNEIFDSIIGAKAATAARWQPVPIVGYWVADGAAAPNVIQGGDYSGLKSSADVEYVRFPCTIDLQPGDRITAIHINAYGTGAGASNISAKLVKLNGGNSTPNDAVASPTPAPAVNTLYTATYAAPVVVAVGDYFVWEVTFAVTNDLCRSVGITKDRL